MKNTRVLAVLNLLALAIHISLSYATQFKLVNTKDVGQISDQYTSLFTPAGITFAIWGLIYVALIMFCIYHLIVAFSAAEPHHPANKDINHIGVWFILNNLGAAAWLVAWTHEQIAASLGLIFFQLVTLIIIHMRTGIHATRRELASRIFTQFPLSIYFGWITIATIANTAIWLSANGWDGFGLGYSAITWTRVMIAIAVFITLLVVLTRRNVFYGLVIVWALYGIITKRQATGATEYVEIIQTAWIGLALVSFICVVQLFRNIITRKEVNTRFPEAVAIK